MATSAHIRPSDTGISYENSFNVTNSYNATYVDEEPKILQWLSPLKPHVRHQDVRTRRLEGVGEWFLQTEGYLNWRDGKDGDNGAVLFCSGAPGSGKTYLSSLVIDRLCDEAVENIAVACLYYDFLAQKEQTPENMLGALVQQIVRALGYMPGEIGDAFQKAKKEVGGRGLLVAEVLKLLQAALSPLDRAYICIDAVDECLPKHLPEFLRSLHAISQHSPKIRIFITGRPHIQSEIEEYFPGNAQFFQMKPKKEDIMKYVEMMLDNDADRDAMNPKLKEDIIERVSQTMSDVFLLVSLRIAAILGEATIYERQERLDAIANGLDLADAYHATLDRVKTQSKGKSRLGMAALMWISRSERPMRISELRHALGVRLGSTDISPENVPSSQTLLASCLGLITVDQEESTVRLVHFTLQEYLNSHSEIFQNSYAKMAEVCLTYLNFDCVNNLSAALYPAPPTLPFLEYASLYWGTYTRYETTEAAKSLALRLLNRFDNHISAKLLLYSDDHAWKFMVDELKPEGFGGLHCVAYFGIDEILTCLLEVKHLNVEGIDCCGRTPLIWAASNGHERIIKTLLDRKNTNPNTKDTKFGRTMLGWAAMRGHCGIVKMILELDGARPESPDDNGRTPLSLAARFGREGVVKLLLERDGVDPESKSKDGRTPLSYAAEGGDVEVVKMLLERDEVSPESQDNNGRTLLSYAAEGGAVEVVKMLLERNEVSPESQDNDGRTPLSYAVEGGDVEVVKMLLERDEVGPESQDNDGRTLLSYAAQGGDVEVVKMLLERYEVSPESQDNNGRTPLSYAAWYGREGVVKLLLERDQVKPESQDNDGRTPLSYAAWFGREGVVNLLLERDGVDPESKSKDGRTPLSYAAQGRNVEAVKMLLERYEVSPESQDNDGRTPLSYAARGGGVEVVKTLLERGEVCPNSQDNDGRTPLFYAAQGGDVEVVKMLLERDEVGPESQDNDGRTLLSYAAEGGAVEVVKMLLERDEVSPESQDNGGRTPLSYAAEGWSVKVIKMLLERYEVNPDSRDNYGRTPLSYAAEYGREGAVKFLLSWDEVNPDLADNDFRTPLSWASEHQSKGVVHLLKAHLAAQTVVQIHNVPAPSSSIENNDQEANPVVQRSSQPDINISTSQQSIEPLPLPAVSTLHALANKSETPSLHVTITSCVPNPETPTPAATATFGFTRAFTYRSSKGPLPEFSAQAFLSSLAKKR